jgi:hypothetical protein
MCVHSSLNQIYWSDIQHGVSSVISNIYVCTSIIKSDIVSWHTTGVCHITMSDLMMNVHTCVTDNVTDTMLYGRSLCQN